MSEQKLYISKPLSKLKLLLGFCFLNLAISSVSYGQIIGKPRIINYPPTDFHYGSQNWSITQDKRGIMYICNTFGIMEYDGIEYRLIELSNNSTARSVDIDSLGVIYVGGANEIGYLVSDNKGKTVYRSLKEKLKKEDQDFTSVWKTFATNDGIYFLSNKKIIRYHNDSLTVMSVDLIPNIGSMAGDLLFVVMEEGLYLVDENELIPILHNEEMNRNFDAYDILEYSKDEVLVINKNGFFLLNTSNLLNSGNYDLKPFPNEIFNYLKTNRLYICLKVDDNTFAFATFDGGIFMMDKAGKLTNRFNKDQGLFDDVVWDVFADKAGNLWAGLNSGIAQIEITSPINRFDELDGIEGKVISCRFHNGKLYASTMSGVFYIGEEELMKPGKKSFKMLDGAKSAVWKMLELDNHLIMASRAGLCVVKDTTVERISETQRVYCMKESVKFTGNIFLGLQDGLAVVEYENSSNGNILITKESILDGINGQIREIVEDNKGNFWLTSQHSGLIYIEFTGSKNSEYEVYNFDTIHGLPQMNENNVYFVNNKLVITSPRGIYKGVMPANGNMNNYRFEPDQGFGVEFFNDRIPVKELFIDCQNKYWILCDKGIGCISGSVNLNDTNHLEKLWDFRPFEQIKSKYSIFNCKEHGVWFSTQSNELCYYDEKDRKNYDLSFSCLIRKVVAGQDSVLFYGTYFEETSGKDDFFTVFSTSQPKKLEPVLRYKNNSLTISYAATSYEDPLSFQYYLEGFDADWSAWTAKTEKEYTNLPERSSPYVFRVKAKNVFGTISSEASYSFIILPPWYRTVYAFVSYFVLLFLLIVALIKIYTYRLKAANTRLELMVDERTAEILAQKDEIEIQKGEIQSQAELLRTKNQLITDSIIYAERIQNAILPTYEQLQKYFQQIFVFYQPRDIVSGDFYWVKEKDRKIILLVADCTGHGVPGAFMSLIANTLIEQLVNDIRDINPGRILDRLRGMISEKLSYYRPDDEILDGMDVALIVVDMEKQELQFSGAHNPIVLIRNDELTIWRGDLMGISREALKMDFNFDTTTIKFQKDDVFYLYTDGYQDQFGGEKLEKFHAKRFRELLLKIHNEDIVKQKYILEKKFLDWKGDYMQIDDILVVGFRI